MPLLSLCPLPSQTVQVIDIKRTSWFDMITQYSAIFGSEVRVVLSVIEVSF